LLRPPPCPPPFPSTTLFRSQSVEPPQVDVSVDRRSREVLWEGGDLLLDSPAAVLRVGVRGKPLGNAAAALRLAHAGEHLEDVGHFPGIVVRAPHVTQAEVVRLALVVA